MGKVALAAKITHVPSMYLSELPGPHHGCRKAAIDGHIELGRRARERGVDTLVVFDVHWLVNSGYHINCCEKFQGIYSSNELPHFVKDMEYDYEGNPALGELIAERANARGIKTRAHQVQSLGLEYGTLVPCRYMNADRRFKVVSVAAWCAWHSLEDSRSLRRGGPRGHREELEPGGDSRERLALPPLQRPLERGGEDLRYQQRVLPSGGSSGPRALAKRRMEDLH